MPVRGEVETELDDVGMRGILTGGQGAPHVQGRGRLGCDFLVVSANALWSLSRLTLSCESSV